ncbi:MAG: 2-dehydropantoate 2-reductase [Vibrio sp.]
MKIGIIGAGAIGSLWAVKLKQAEHNVLVISRDKSVSSINLQLGDDSSHTFAANQLEQFKSCNLILITVKSTQVVEAMSPLFAYLSPQTPLIFLHNGMGAVDELSSEWHQFPIAIATTTQAAFKPNSNQVNHTGLGQTLLGNYDETRPVKPQITPYLEALNHVLPEVIWHDEIQSALWKKLAVNSVINPMTAVYQCKNGALVEDKYQPEVQALIQQCHAVMKAENQTITLEELSSFIQQVMVATAENYSSMYQDITHQRATEIDFISGFLIKKAQLHGIDVSAHHKLYTQIKNLS